jgi:hypothetical protein
MWIYTRMRHLKYFTRYIFESTDWDSDWKSLPQWELLSLMGFRDVTIPSDKKKVQIVHPEFSDGVLNLTRAGYIRRPGMNGFQFQFGKGSQTPLSEILDHVITRYIKKGISRISNDDLDRIILKDPKMIDLLYELPKVQDGISSRTSLENPKGDYYKKHNITPAIVKWLDNCTRKTWTVNEETGRIDASTFKPKSPSTSGFRGIKFGVIQYDFDCSEMGLETLEGGPIKVGGNFNCGSNKLVDLVGSPLEVGANFNCGYNKKLESLKGCTPVINGSLNLFGCKGLINLEGCPREIKGGIRINTQEWTGERYSLESLKGIPRKIGGGLSINGERIKWDLDNPEEILAYSLNEKYPEKDRAYFFPYISDKLVAKWIKENPLKMYLLDPYPDLKKRIIEITGLRDLSKIGKALDLGLF